MAEKAPTEEEAEGAGPCESFLDQFLRRLDQTTDHDAGDSPSTSGSMALASSSSEYPSTNPWSFISSASLNSELPTHGLLYPGSSLPAPYTPNPLAEFPWLLQEFDPPRPGLDSRLPGGPDTDAQESAQRLYSSYQLLGSSSQSLPRGEQVELPTKEEPASQNNPTPGGHGGGGSSSSKWDAGPVPRFGSAEEARPAGLSSGHFSDPASQILGARNINYRPPTSPLLSEATAAGAAAGGSVTTSAGTSNTSMSSGPSTSNAGDEEESGKKEAEASSSSRKRKKTEAAAGGGSGEEAGASGDTPKADPPKSKPRKRGGAKRLREPRYAIKTRTDVDVLDDGFKWRKYGQKAVKNSPHPRNYYRCTTPACPVRKRVERSNEDAGLVITTYEGTHTHQTPGFHRPSAGGYFGDRPLGMGGGLFQNPVGPTGASLLPLPPGFDLASLQQANALRTFRGLQPNPSFPQQQHQQHQQQLRQLGLQQESLFRAQQFLGLQDPTFGSSIKQESFQFTAQPEGFLSRLPRPFPDLQGASPSLPRSFPELPLPRSGPLFAGLPVFPTLQSPGPGPSPGPKSSNIILPSREPDTRRQEILNAGVGGSSSSSRMIDQSLDTLVSSSAGRPNFEESAGPAGRNISSHTLRILGSGSVDPRGQPRAPLPPQQPQQQQQQQLHQQQQQQRSVRSGLAAAGLGSSSSENLQGPDFESSSSVATAGRQGQAEGLLQDMVRPGGPKVSKS